MEGVTSMADLLTQLGNMFTTVMTNIGTVAETVVDTPLLLVGCAMMFTGACIGFFRRLLSAS